MLKTSILFLALGIASAIADSSNPNQLGLGDSVPSVAVRLVSGDTVNLREKASEQTSVLIFYRGGWCPFCTRHLKELAAVGTNAGGT